MNPFYKPQASHKWTWYRWNGEEQRYTDMSMIDLFATNNKCLFTDVKAIPSMSLDSGHRMVLAKIKRQKTKKKTQKRQKE